MKLLLNGWSISAGGIGRYCILATGKCNVRKTAITRQETHSTLCFNREKTDTLFAYFRSKRLYSRCGMSEVLENLKETRQVGNYAVLKIDELVCVFGIPTWNDNETVFE